MVETSNEEYQRLQTRLKELESAVAVRKRAEEALRKAYDELETRVEERTAELAKVNKKLQNQITERQQAEEALEAAHAFRQAIIDGVAEPIMVIGIDYRVRLMNRAAREFSSGGADVSESLLCYQISHRRETPCDGIEHPCPLEQVRESGQPVTVVHEHYQANGERRVVEVIASPLWGADGTFQGIIESVR
ncbi:MAG: PAS domain-containing protein, partial [Anaerolineae bacterium]|nr:PAS domain-containing protein [Anaerolineae bacterium]